MTDLAELDRRGLRYFVPIGADGVAVGGGSFASPLYVASAVNVIDVTMALDTSQLAVGDVMGTTVEVANVVPVAGMAFFLHSLRVHEEDDQGQAFDVVFMDSNVSLGTANSGPNISDANGRSILGRVRVGTSDFIDLGGCRSATMSSVGLAMEAAAGQTSIWLSGICRSGTPTYSASGIRLKLGVAY